MATSFSTENRQESGISGKALLAAALVVIVLVAIAAVATLRRPSATNGAADPYASKISVSGMQLSEATNGAGGKVTYVDGVVKNEGGETLRAATVKVTFATEDGSPSQTQTVPLTLVRTRQPYVDLEPVSAEPVAPGGSHDFRLIFESVTPNWDQKEPAIQIVHTEVR